MISRRYVAVITHRGLWWRECSMTALVTTTNELRLDGKPQSEPHPVDKSESRCETTIEPQASQSHSTHRGLAVVTRTVYVKHGHSQVVTRWLEDDGLTCVRSWTTAAPFPRAQPRCTLLRCTHQRYVVTNDITLAKTGVVLKAKLFFDRRDPEADSDDDDDGAKGKRM